MKKTLLALSLLLAASTAAMATDLPSQKGVPLPPIQAQSFDQFYVLGFGGTSFPNSVFGGAAGVNVNQNISGEVSYTYVNPAKGNDAKDQVVGNIIPTLNLTKKFSVYGLAGAGYTWNNVSGQRPIWNTGAGVQYSLTDHVKAELRYTYTGDFSRNTIDNGSMVTTGLVFGF